MPCYFSVPISGGRFILRPVSGIKILRARQRILKAEKRILTVLREAVNHHGRRRTGDFVVMISMIATILGGPTNIFIADTVVPFSP